jgi:hypothetical protein
VYRQPDPKAIRDLVTKAIPVGEIGGVPSHGEVSLRGRPPHSASTPLGREDCCPSTANWTHTQDRVMGRHRLFFERAPLPTRPTRSGPLRMPLRRNRVEASRRRIAFDPRPHDDGGAVSLDCPRGHTQSLTAIITNGDAYLRLLEPDEPNLNEAVGTGENDQESEAAVDVVARMRARRRGGVSDEALRDQDLLGAIHLGLERAPQAHAQRGADPLGAGLAGSLQKEVRRRRLERQPVTNG